MNKNIQLKRGVFQTHASNLNIKNIWWWTTTETNIRYLYLCLYSCHNLSTFLWLCNFYDFGEMSLITIHALTMRTWFQMSSATKREAYFNNLLPVEMGEDPKGLAGYLLVYQAIWKFMNTSTISDSIVVSSRTYKPLPTFSKTKRAIAFFLNFLSLN